MQPSGAPSGIHYNGMTKSHENSIDITRRVEEDGPPCWMPACVDAVEKRTADWAAGEDAERSRKGSGNPI